MIFAGGVDAQPPKSRSFVENLPFFHVFLAISRIPGSRDPRIPDSGILEFWNSRILEMADLKA